MFNKLKKWYWWAKRDKEVGYDFEDSVARLFNYNLTAPRIMVNKTIVIVSKDSEVYQKYLAYCVKHDILDKEVDTCVKLANKRIYKQNYEQAVEYLRTNTTKEENSNDWN